MNAVGSVPEHHEYAFLQKRRLDYGKQRTGNQGFGQGNQSY